MSDEEFRVGECDIMEWVLPIEPEKNNINAQNDE